jgi:hypothetical protein
MVKSEAARVAYGDPKRDCAPLQDLIVVDEERSADDDMMGVCVLDQYILVMYCLMVDCLDRLRAKDKGWGYPVDGIDHTGFILIYTGRPL